MVVQCSACINNYRNNKHISYFNYPKESTRRQDWLIAVGREDLIPKLFDDKRRQQYRICEDHFERTNIKFSKNQTVKYLFKNAFPTLNLKSNADASTSQRYNRQENLEMQDTSVIDPSVVCGACLSHGRRLSMLGAVRADHIMRAVSYKTGCYTSEQELSAWLQVCWECRALADKSLLFCERVWRAQTTLNTGTVQIPGVSMSTLTASRTLGFDYEFNHTDNVACDSKERNPLEWVVVPTVKIEIVEDFELLSKSLVETFKDMEDLSKTIDDGSNSNLILDCKESIVPIKEPAVNAEQEESENKDIKPIIHLALDPSSNADSENPLNVVDCTDASLIVEEPVRAMPPATVPDGAREADGAKPSSTVLDGVRITLMSEKERQDLLEQDRNDKQYLKSLYKCETCIIGFVNALFLSEHNERKHKTEIGPFVCDLCAVRYAKENLFWAHRAKHFQRYACTECDFTERSHAVVKRHYRDTHQPDKIYSCGKCAQTFAMHRQLKKHLREHMRDRKCPHCDQVFESTKYYNHVATHERLPHLECAVCNKKCKTRASLKTHMRAHTCSGEEAFCVECNRQFKDKFTYQWHLKSSLKHITTDDLRYPCDKCSKRFVAPSLLQAHHDIVHLNKELYKCDKCGKSYNCASALRMHVRKVHDGVRPTKDKICEICKRAFSNKAILREHLRTHTGERPYACAECGATFRQSGALHKHGELVHGRKSNKKQQ